ASAYESKITATYPNLRLIGTNEGNTGTVSIGITSYGVTNQCIPSDIPMVGSRFGLGHLVPEQRTLKPEVYSDILDSSPGPTLRQQFEESPIRFHQDRAPICTERLVTK
ncbi:hypothetical protein NPIL_167831, partial [Nephila pilipes]